MLDLKAKFLVFCTRVLRWMRRRSNRFAHRLAHYEYKCWAASKRAQGLSRLRLATCETCPNYVRKGEAFITRFKRKLPPKSCKLCGCYMPWKVTLLRAKCPEKRW